MDETKAVQPCTWTPVADVRTRRRTGGAAAPAPSISAAPPIDVERALDDWGDTVLRLALCKVGNRADAEDITQTVFLKLCQNHRVFESADHLKAWLLRVTLNCCADLYRDPWRQRRVSVEESQAAFDRAAARPDTATPGTTPEESAPPVQAAMDALTDKQRIAVHLHYYEGYSTQEIAQITEEAPATVRSHLHRARAALKTMIGDTDA